MERTRNRNRIYATLAALGLAVGGLSLRAANHDSDSVNPMTGSHSSSNPPQRSAGVSNPTPSPSEQPLFGQSGESVISNRPSGHYVFRIGGKLCVDGTVYGAVNNRVEALPNEGCSENTTTVAINTSISVNNNGPEPVNNNNTSNPGITVKNNEFIPHINFENNEVMRNQSNYVGVTN